ncbi:MAG: CotH kinase family protein, partial [Planctomycetales bacterium]|nr:CotH kinase family protein [Planctomycetales bacterium]
TVLHSFGEAGFPAQRPDISYGLLNGEVGYLLTPTPGEANTGEALKGIPAGPTIDQPHGFFTEPVQVTITNNDANTTLIYTLDGSAPTPSNGTPYAGPITIDKTTVVRAAAIQEGYLTSRVDTRSYIFLTDVLTQSANGQPPEGWPARWGSNATDYGMDPDIVNDATWGPQIQEALTQIPSMSIVTDLANLYDTRTGIYSHASSDGVAWERPASLELINPDGTIGFQHNIGLRIRGGFSRSNDNPKHAFRVFFDSSYGDGWLNYPLFGDEGTNSFAKVDLRTSQNYSWAFQNDAKNTFLRDIFSRDLQGEMGNEYTKGRFYHLYINGQYFGLYQTDERPEANFAASYYGGNPDDFDVIHNDPRANGATNGNLDAYRRLWEHFVQDGGLGDANSEDYYRVQGMNPDGSRNPEYERLLDVDNVIDYMIITYYTSDADGPGSKFTRPGLNNYFTIFNRENPDGFKFFEHDSEHSLDTGNAAGANYNMVSPLVNNGRTFAQFNPHWMHEQLANSNSDYLIRFQDRVKELFADDGLLGDANVFKLLDNRASQIDKAIIAESARWGDAKRARPFTKTDWDRAVNGIKNWVTTRQSRQGRRAEVLTQLSRVDWWNFNINSPTFSQDGGQVDAGYQLTVNVEGDGAIYVTTDGSDPRELGGSLNPSAVLVPSGGKVTVPTGMTVRARTLNGNDWSPATVAQFIVEPLASVDSLHVSELNYHPADPTAAEEAAGFTDADDFEYIELVNVSDQTIDLAGVAFAETVSDFDRQGINFEFDSGSVTKLAPGARV